MATSATQTASGAVRTLGVTRLLITGAATAAVVFVVCWLGTFVPFGSSTHAYIGLFTSAEISSGRALAEGTAWSLLFGGLVAGLFALIYNRAGALVRR
jgi:hypothetical protein